MYAARRVLAALATVLAVAGVGVVLRGVLPSEAAGPRAAKALLTSPKGGAKGFSLKALQSRAVPQGWSLIAVPRKRAVRVHAKPRKARQGKSRMLKPRRFNGQVLPLRFMVVDKKRGWVRVQLPFRPNRSTGWIKRAHVRVRTTPYRIVVERRAHRLILLRADRRVLTVPVAIGNAATPTPAGKYYVTDLIKSTDPFFGPYALGLSAHSPVLKEFLGGPGQLGIHGTNQPSLLGSDVSKGCIRVANRVIRKLARIVPVGTPVAIR